MSRTAALWRQFVAVLRPVRGRGAATATRRHGRALPATIVVLILALVAHMAHETLVLSASSPHVRAALLRANLVQGAGLLLLALALFVWLRRDTAWVLLLMALLAVLFLAEGVGHLRGLIAGRVYAPNLSGLVAVIGPFILFVLSADALLSHLYPDGGVASGNAIDRRDHGASSGEQST
ncbi:MAG TPA: hypothetical protein VFE42_15390 [Chloroflexota bacterium]|nr:hypothetical protein [Chloroflexota bacterium]